VGNMSINVQRTVLQDLNRESRNSRGWCKHSSLQRSIAHSSTSFLLWALSHKLVATSFSLVHTHFQHYIQPRLQSKKDSPNVSEPSCWVVHSESCMWIIKLVQCKADRRHKKVALLLTFW
jgi:hypothetical protein